MCGAEAASTCTPCAKVTSAGPPNAAADEWMCLFVRAMAAGWLRTESVCRSRRSSRITLPSRIATGKSPLSRRRPDACGWPGSMKAHALSWPVQAGSIASQARATAISREWPGCRRTRWLPFRIGRRRRSPLVVPTRINLSMCFGFRRTDTWRRAHGSSPSCHLLVDAIMSGGQGPLPRVLTIMHTPKDANDVLNAAEVAAGPLGIERLLRLVDSGSWIAFNPTLLPGASPVRAQRLHCLNPHDASRGT